MCSFIEFLCVPSSEFLCVPFPLGSFLWVEIHAGIILSLRESILLLTRIEGKSGHSEASSVFDKWVNLRPVLGRVPWSFEVTWDYGDMGLWD